MRRGASGERRAHCLGALGLRRAQVAQLCGGLLDEFGCELDRCVPGLVGNMLRSELPMGSLRVEADEGAFGVRSKRTGTDDIVRPGGGFLLQLFFNAGSSAPVSVQ